jgi:hypothetical protein
MDCTISDKYCSFFCLAFIMYNTCSKAMYQLTSSSSFISLLSAEQNAFPSPPTSLLPHHRPPHDDNVALCSLARIGPLG